MRTEKKQKKYNAVNGDIKLNSTSLILKYIYYDSFVFVWYAEYLQQQEKTVHILLILHSFT